MSNHLAPATITRTLAASVVHYATPHTFPVTIPAGTPVIETGEPSEYGAAYVVLRGNGHTFGIRRADLDRIAPLD